MLPDQWCFCLLEDTLDGERVFDHLETFIAQEKGRVIGFVQVGHPRFSWDVSGQIFYNPEIGVIRHFYFDSGRLDVADAMYAQVQTFLKPYPQHHAFYHVYGMSCNAHHGKLHMSLKDVDAFLQGKGFQIEHENVYYSLALNEAGQPVNSGLRLVSQPHAARAFQDYEIWLYDTHIGTVKVRFLEHLTGGAKTDTTYLNLITIEKAYRGCGWGTQALWLLVKILRDKGYAYLHLDTVGTNDRAQRFYERLGFQNRGRSRNYIHKVTNE